MNFGTPKWVSQHKIMYFCGMFIRKKKNPSGVISVQIIDKSKGKYKVVRTIGSSKDELFVDDLIKKGRQWIENQIGTPDMFKQKAREE